jgi:SNF2 family DNA or RNA helicase
VGKHWGKCALCGKECELTFEHIPPRAAFNSTPARPVSGVEVLTEKNLSVQFRAELVKFTGEFVHLIPDGLQKTIDKFTRFNPYECELDYSVVGTHALLTTKGFIQWLEQCRTMGKGFPFDCLIIDESSVLGNSTTGISKGFTAIKKYFKHIYFLNATPFETQLGIFYNQLNMLDGALLPTKENFTKEYCVMDYRGMYPKPTGKYKNQEQFKQLVGYRYFARTRRDKGAVMEDCNGKVVLSKLSDIQRKWLDKSQLHRMVFDCPNHIDPSIEFNSENVPKLGSLSELLKNECADAETIIIFSHFKEAQKSLSEWLKLKGYSNRVLNGDTDNISRQEIIKGFKNKEFRVLITNVQRGLNFGDCNHCIFYSFDPNPSKMIQFEGRITRSFDIVGKNVFILCSQGEEYKKLNEVVRQRAKATAQFTNTDLSVIMDILLGE